MSDGVLISLIATVGGLVAVITWKVLDIGRRAMELEKNGRHGARRADDEVRG